jgi:large subunit ribosomal protein L22
VGAGPTLKRWRARARGRVGRIKKRTCHITIALAPPGGEAIPEPIERPAPVTLTEEPEPIVVDETALEEKAPAAEEQEVAAEEAAVEEAETPEPEAEAKPKTARKKKAKTTETESDEGSES